MTTLVNQVFKQLANCATKKAETDLRCKTGLMQSTYALNSSSFPYFRAFMAVPQDGMHTLYCSGGVVQSELAELIYVLVKENEVSLDAINDAIESYSWPAEKERAPLVHPSVTVGAKGGLPSKGATLRMNGAQTLHFARHATAILTPLLAPGIASRRAGPAWQSWKMLSRVVQIVDKHLITVSDVRDLDLAILEYSDCYGKVPQYEGHFRPKHHFLTHLPLNSFLCGPVRAYWCFSFEAKNQEVKLAVEASNYKDACGSAIGTLAYQAARKLKRRRCEL